MQLKRFLAPAAALLLTLSLCACSKKAQQQAANSSNCANQTSTDQTSTDQTSANQTSGNQTSASQPDANAGAPSSNVSNGVQVANVPATGSATSTASNAPEPLTIPAGTPITVRLQESLSSRSAVPGERFEAVVDEPVVVNDRVVLPVGALVTGHVVVARRSGRLHHPGELGLTLDTVTIGQQQISLATSRIGARGGSHKKRNWAWIGGGSGGGAVIGALAAGGKGALIGSGIGAVAGTTTAFVTGRKDVGFGAERRLRFRLRNDISLSA